MKISQNTPLASYTSLGVGGPAANLVVLDEGDDLPAALTKAQTPVWVLGYGTNSLISDQGLPGTVVINQGGQIEDLGSGQLRAGSGVNWDQLVQTAIAKNLWGLELMSGIPGGVGAAITGNIAAYGQQIADTLVEAHLLDSRDGQIVTWSKDQFGFAYRHSNLQEPDNQQLVVLDATFQLSGQQTTELSYGSALKAAQELGLQPDNLEHRRQIILAARQKAGALLGPQDSAHTAGSFFKNPLVASSQVDQLLANEEFGLSRDQVMRQNQIHGGSSVRVSAAHVLLAAGFQRGQAWGPVRLHPDHILKLENTGGATAAQIYGVVQEIINTVQSKLNITLEPEVRFLGQF